MAPKCENRKKKSGSLIYSSLVNFSTYPQTYFLWLSLQSYIEMNFFNVTANIIIFKFYTYKNDTPIQDLN